MDSSSSSSSSSTMVVAGDEGGAHAPPALALSAAELAGIAAKLHEAIDASSVKFRPIPGGRQCAYMPADETIGVANESFGFHRWACTIKELKLMHATKEDDGRWTIAYMCTMRVAFMDAGRVVCFHEDVGYGASERSPRADQAFEQACKSAVTDARKRCLRLFGPGLGQNVNSADFQKAAAQVKASSGQHQPQQLLPQPQQLQQQRPVVGAGAGAGAAAVAVPAARNGLAAVAMPPTSLSSSSSSSSHLTPLPPQQPTGAVLGSSAAGAANGGSGSGGFGSVAGPGSGGNGGTGGNGSGNAFAEARKRRAEEQRQEALRKRAAAATSGGGGGGGTEQRGAGGGFAPAASASPPAPPA